MLFNSYDFILGFLPIVLIVHQLLLSRGPGRAARFWLAAVSLFFYAYWYPPYLLLLLASLAANYVFGRLVADTARGEGTRRTWLRVAVTSNLLLLGFYKYAGFLVRNVDHTFGLDWSVPAYALPIGISFFTFQQIAYVVDSHRTSTYAKDPLDYVLFVTFFPHLIAGPLVHHGEMIPQFRAMRKPDGMDRAVGITMFVIGLAKKVIIADSLSPHADKIFGNVAMGHAPTFLGAWTGILAFFFQVYFDFSGYSDMAVGLSRMLGLKLPVNFDAPYRSDNMIEFWRRWHITLSRFLRDYLYIPLGGSRQGAARRYANMVITMTLGGLWHGAEWTYVIWGALNGFYLLVNHGWQYLMGGPVRRAWFRVFARALTIVSAMVGHTFFRAADLDDAFRMLRSMAGAGGSGIGIVNGTTAWMLFLVFAMSQLAPTSQRWLEAFEPTLQQWRDEIRWPAWLTWQPTARWGVVMGLLALVCIPLLERASAFIYFQF